MCVVPKPNKPAAPVTTKVSEKVKEPTNVPTPNPNRVGRDTAGGVMGNTSSDSLGLSGRAEAFRRILLGS